MKAVEDDRAWRPQERGECVGGIDAALVSRAQQRCQDLLRLCAPRGAIATAAHLSSDHRGSQGVLGAPIGGIERRVEEEAEDGLKFGPQMDGKAAGIGESARPPVEQGTEAMDVVAAGNREAVVRHVAESMAIACRQGGLQERVDLRRKRMVRMVQHHGATATEQVSEARLMRGVDKLPVRRPAVALQDAAVAGPEHARRLGKAAPVFDRVGRGVRGGKSPQPVGMAADLPARFIGRDDGTAAHRGAERLVGGLRLTRRAVDRVHQPAAGDGEAEAIAEQRYDAAEGKAALFVQDHREGDGMRTELHRGGAQRVGRLQRMTPLHAAVTLAALADGHTKLVHDGSLHRQIFLVLRHHATAAYRPATIWTVRGQRRLMGEIDARGRAAVGSAAVRDARLAPWSLGMFFGQPARKRCRLPIRPPTRHVEFVFQPLVFAPQAIALDLRPQEVFLQSFDLTRLIVDDLLRVTRRRIWRAPSHASVMPDSRVQYKKEMGIRELTR